MEDRKPPVHSTTMSESSPDTPTHEDFPWSSQPSYADSLLAVVRRHWGRVLLVGAIGAAMAYGVSYLFPHIYAAEVLVTVVTDQGSGGSLRSLMGRYAPLASLAGVDIPENDNSSAIVAVLNSHKLVEKFIADEQLLPAFFPNKWDEHKLVWKTSHTQVPTLQDGGDLFLKRILTITQDRRTGLITIRVRWRHRQQVASWANKLVAQANSMTRADAIESASRNIEYLKAELGRVESLELKQSIYALMQSQMNNRMLATTRPEYAFKVIDPARTPSMRDRVAPLRIEFVVIGFALAAVAALVAALVMEKKHGNRGRVDRP